VPRLGPFLWHSPWCSSAPPPVGQINIPVTFGTQKKLRTENVQFEMAYNIFLGWPSLSKFMVIPHYAYLVLKMPGPRGVISVRGDTKWAYDCDRESCETADRLMASVELQEAGLGRVSTEPSHA
jgi:hypothetical protein